GMFSEMLDDIDKSILWGLFHARLEQGERARRARDVDSGVAVHQVAGAYGAGRPAAPVPDGAGAEPKSAPPPPPGGGISPAQRDLPKVGRNDPCPCGSGKKYKKCCGRNSV
ncbi:MAG TPA: SEC-C metal-binding domain-containing protein, partial [Candidatus Krumholzibacterium sp.]|nr:SEC-C metal-binding domain-containing protein [Candidatus Krumholzibacterium sp.]